MSSANHQKVKVVRLTMLLLLLPCLLSLPLLAACSNSSSIASVDNMEFRVQLAYIPGVSTYAIEVLLKPNNARPDIFYVARLYEGNLFVCAAAAHWSKDDLLAHRDCLVTFPLKELPPQLSEGIADVKSIYHVTISNQ